jgi:hypothetical protein
MEDKRFTHQQLSISLTIILNVSKVICSISTLKENTSSKRTKVENWFIKASQKGYAFCNPFSLAAD